MHHRRHDEGQLVAACLKGVALLDDVHPRAEIVAAEKLRYHRPYLVVAYHARLRVALQKQLKRRRVIRFHVRDDDVVKPAPAERMVDVIKELPEHGLVHRVEEHGLLIEHQV